MALGYKLSGDMIECCDCFTICPCWVNDSPDEDHCSALYAWVFKEGSEIEGQAVGGFVMAAATYHGKGKGGQAALYADDRLTPQVRDLLFEAFSGRAGGDLKAISSITGAVIDTGPATIRVKLSEGGWTIEVKQGASTLASSQGNALHADANAKPISLDNSALHKELGLQGAVVVQSVEHFEMAVAPLPGGSFSYQGRSGMRASFAYAGRGR
jgi:hypothetical protein